MRIQIEKFLEKFPKDAACWSRATDEIRDLASMSREYLEQYDGVIVEPLDFRSYKTPAQWNSNGRDYILANFDKMSLNTKKAYFERFREWFEVDPRGELIQQIYDLHAEAKKTDYGECLISREQLENHLAMQNDQTLSVIKRFYKGLSDNIQ